MDDVRVEPLLSALAPYRQARLALLDVLGLGQSNRDPLAEWSEWRRTPVFRPGRFASGFWISRGTGASRTPPAPWSWRNSESVSRRI